MILTIYDPVQSQSLESVFSLFPTAAVTAPHTRGSDLFHHASNRLPYGVASNWAESNNLKWKYNTDLVNYPTPYYIPGKIFSIFPS